MMFLALVVKNANLRRLNTRNVNTARFQVLPAWLAAFVINRIDFQESGAFQIVGENEKGLKALFHHIDFLVYENKKKLKRNKHDRDLRCFSTKQSGFTTEQISCF